MAHIVNLNKARKRKLRLEGEQRAAENRIKFGRSKAQKKRDELAAVLAQERLDQLRREPPSE